VRAAVEGDPDRRCPPGDDILEPPPLVDDLAQAPMDATNSRP
jgi:hypothetical protein